MQSATTGSSPDSSLIMLIVVILNLVTWFSRWLIFQKAGRPGWYAIVPIYNTIVTLDIVRKPVWWIVLFFFPITIIVGAIMVNLELGKVFGKSGVWSFFLLYLCPFIGYPILAADNSEYLYNKKVINNDGFNSDPVKEIENLDMLISPAQTPNVSSKINLNNPNPAISAPNNSPSQVTTEKLPK